MLLQSKNERQTIKIAKKIAKKILPGSIILLNGDLGSGKTVFARGIARGLKIKDAITSPTFTIYNHFYNKKYDLYHFDMYRIESMEEALNFGIDEIIDNDGIKIFEWPDVIKSILPKNLIEINIKKVDENKRDIEIKVNK